MFSGESTQLSEPINCKCKYTNMTPTIHHESVCIQRRRRNGGNIVQSLSHVKYLPHGRSDVSDTNCPLHAVNTAVFSYSLCDWYHLLRHIAWRSSHPLLRNPRMGARPSMRDSDKLARLLLGRNGCNSPNTTLMVHQCCASLTCSTGISYPEATVEQAARPH